MCSSNQIISQTVLVINGSYGETPLEIKQNEEKTSWRNRIYGVTATRGELYRIGITPNHAMRTSSLLWRNQEL